MSVAMQTLSPPYSSLLTSVFLVFCSWCAAGQRLPHVIVDDDFNSGDSWGWTGVTVVDQPSAADKSIQVLSGGIKRKFAEQASQFEVSFGLLPNANVKLYLIDRSDRTALYFRTMSDGRLLCYGGSSVLELGSYTQSTWVHLMAGVNMAGLNFTIAVDGVEVGSADLTDALQPIDRFRMKFEAATFVLIDNFKITSDTPHPARSRLDAAICMADKSCDSSIIGDIEIGEEEGQYPMAAHAALAQAIGTATVWRDNAAATPYQLQQARDDIESALIAFIRSQNGRQRQLNSPEDYVLRVKDYADAMLKYGRDDSRYGDKTSPLFAVTLDRGSSNCFDDETTCPKLLPYPEFEPFEDGGRPGSRWLFYWNPGVEQSIGSGVVERHVFRNIPTASEQWNWGEDPHKYTVVGSDPIDNVGLYRTLYTLSEVLGDPQYAKAADDALGYFFQNTQGCAGLWAWGEQLGWDFRHDYVAYQVPGHEEFLWNAESNPKRLHCSPYYNGMFPPSGTWNGVPYVSQVFESYAEEPRLFEHVPDFLRMHARDASGSMLCPVLSGTPFHGKWCSRLEGYALGVWKEHFFDKGDGLYNRHGDYFGRGYNADDDPFDGWEQPSHGEGMFPKYGGFWTEMWAEAYLQTSSMALKAEFLSYITKTAQAFISQYKEGTKDNQLIQYAGQLDVTAKRIAEVNGTEGTIVQALSDHLLDSIWNDTGSNHRPGSMRALTGFQATGRPEFRSWVDNHVSDVLNGGSWMKSPSHYAHAIRLMIFAYHDTNDEKYLKKAEDLAKTAVPRYIDLDSPLPRYRPDGPVVAPDGSRYIPEYTALVNLDDFMHSIILTYQARYGTWVAAEDVLIPGSTPEPTPLSTPAPAPDPIGGATLSPSGEPKPSTMSGPATDDTPMPSATPELTPFPTPGRIPDLFPGPTQDPGVESPPVTLPVTSGVKCFGPMNFFFCAHNLLLFLDLGVSVAAVCYSLSSH